ncbi:heterocyst-inhibiting protein PatX [Scytonema sp. NUACC26]|uniref:heterocyst-inhibiting protein PatX n=1 Tax=Scytonema sp. NUACC26 TaxID=3140176 RepID=UPI0034DB86E5
MRAAVSLLIVGFLCSSFAINNQVPNTFSSKYESPQLILARTTRRATTPPPGTSRRSPYRGSGRGPGRRELMEFISTTQSDV